MSDNTSVHRLLDEAFAGVAMTPEVQDLKEEIRTNLVDRVTELAAGGASPVDAARRAVDELGDVRAIVQGQFPGSVPDGAARTHGDVDDDALLAADGHATRARRESAAALAARHRVRPRPGYVAVTVLMSIVLAGSLVGTVLAAAGVARAETGPWLPTLFTAAAAGALGWIVGASLAQETTNNYPMPAGRAALFALGWALVLLGALLAVAHLIGSAPPAWLALDGLALVAGVMLLAYLATTSTNRTKPWALEQSRRHAEAGSRFDEDPAAAARFGIYTVVLWTLTGAAIFVVGSTAGWTWVPVPALIGFAVFMLLLARMNFGPASTRTRE